MPSRKDKFTEGSFYHCYNRGVDKRVIFNSATDYNYFLNTLELFNQIPSRGDMSHYKQSHLTNNDAPLVSIIAYCLNPNHFHLLLTPKTEDGITHFMRKISTGYTMYFNNKNDRSGSLFQGQFKSVLVKDHRQLRHLFAYVTKNNLIHGIRDEKKFRSSYQETVGQKVKKICDLDTINSIFDEDLNKLVATGIKYTQTYRKSLHEKVKSEFLE